MTTMVSTVLERFKQEYAAETDLKKRLGVVWFFAHMYFDSYRSFLQEVLKKELAECEKANYFDGQIQTRIYLSFISFDGMDIQNASMHMDFITQNLHKIEDLSIRTHAQNFTAYIYSYQGKYDMAFKMIYELLQDTGEKCNTIDYGWLIYALGVFYYDLKDYDNSEIRYVEALAHFKKMDFPYGVTRSKTGLASVYMQQERFLEAETLMQESLSEYSAFESISGQSRVYNDLGTIALRQGDPEKALLFFNKALEIRRRIPHLQGIATSLNDIAHTLIEIGKPDEALPYVTEARDLCITIRNKSKQYRSHYLLYKIYRSKGDDKLALENFEEFDRLKSDVLGEAASNKIKALQTKMATEKSEKEAEIERLKNVDLKSAYDIIEEKNKEILDSINYAKRIQHAILPNHELIKKHAPNSFVLYKPKDIVAGDFYWFVEISEHEYFIAACDCTGHGVPGAMVSVVCHNALNRAVLEYKFRVPGEILDKTRELVIEQFEKSDEEVKDGMDISLLYVNKKTNQLQWAGANNPLWLIRNGQLTELKPNKQPIGKFITETPFNTQQQPYEKNDILYLFTDGLQDQFGGPKGKKFKASNLQQLVLSICKSGMNEQVHELNSAFENWRGSLEQVDDVCAIGIKI
ncbi:MAG: tetratricopeptide repeat protein [Flavobacteriales bacterium]